MSWNHRVVKKTYTACKGTELEEDEVWYGLHEIHYDEDEPWGCTKDAVSVAGESIEDLRWTLEQMLKALDEPILDYKDFDTEGEELKEQIKENQEQLNKESSDNIEKEL